MCLLQQEVKIRTETPVVGKRLLKAPFCEQILFLINWGLLMCSHLHVINLVVRALHASMKLVVFIAGHADS